MVRLHTRRACRAALGLLTAACVDARGGQAACREAPIAWSEARTIWSEQADTIQPYPASAGVHDGVIYATAVHLGGPPKNSMFAVKAPLTGGEPVILPFPPGGTYYDNPIIAATPDGGATAVWGERYEQLGDSVGDSSVRSLWSSSFDGKRWSPAERIVSGYSLRWYPQSQSELVVASDGAVHLAVAPILRPGTNVILHLVRRHGRWTTHEVPSLSFDAVYVTLAVYGDRVSVAYVSALRGVKDLNSMFFNSSADGGRTWGPGQLVSRSGQRGATNPRLVAASPRDLHLVWGQNYTGGTATDAIRHVMSADGGRTWTAPADLSAPHRPFQVRGAVLGEGGNLYVLFTQHGADALAAARWCGGKWSGAQTAPASELFSAQAELLPIASDRATALWSDMELTSPRTVDLRWRIATVR